MRPVSVRENSSWCLPFQTKSLGLQCIKILNTYHSPLIKTALLILLLILQLGTAATAQEIGSVHPTLGEIGTNDERLPLHLDSIISLGVVIYAILVAYWMNHTRPGMRVMGVFAAALGCLAAAAGIIGLDIAGEFTNVREPLLPLDGSKPILMRTLAGIFGFAGLFLIMVGIGQRKRTDNLSLPVRNQAERFGKRSRAFHWIIAVLFLLLIPMGIFTTMIPFDEEFRNAFYVIHKSLGFTVMILAIGRIAWLIISPPPKLDSRLNGWEKFLAHGAHYMLYLFLFAFPISGFLLSTWAGKLSHFYFWDTPLLWAPDENMLKLPAMIHKLVLPYLFYLAFLGHVIGALKHQFIDKHTDTFKRMVT